MKTGKLVYITVPSSLAEQFRHAAQRNSPLLFDPALPLPVELPPEKDRPSAEDLSVEAILSGILLHLAENSNGENTGYYRRLIAAVKPDLSAELLDAAAVKTRSGDYDTALEIFRLVEGIDPANPALLLNRALTLEQRGASDTSADLPDSSDVAAAWEEALSHPVSDTFFYAALFYEKEGDYAKAAECLAAYLEAVEEEDGADSTGADENSGEYGEGFPAENTGEEKRTKARELLAEIRNNGLEDGAFREALFLIRRGEEEAGILKVRGFLERRPGAARGWFLLGWGLRRLSRWEDGTACFEKALELGCVNADTRNELAICLMEKGRLAEARFQLEEALRLDPDSVKIISNLGVLAMKEGDKKKAAAFFRTVLELEPDDPVAGAFYRT